MRNSRTICGLGLALTMLSTACQSSSNDATASSSPPAAGGVSDTSLNAFLTKAKHDLKFVEGGSFQMGDFGPLHSPEKLPYSSAIDNKPLHRVTLDSFSMSAEKITYADYDVYAEATGTAKTGMVALRRGKRHPQIAASVTWQQARDYCQWLGKQLSLPMDLPTEAQWEYAARNRGQFWVVATDNGEMEIGRNALSFDARVEYAEKHGLTELEPSLPLRHFPANPLGLYDMFTEGQEWMLDWYAPDYYAHSPEKNPSGPASGTRKVLRSSYGANGEHLIMGDGLSITRSSQTPDPVHDMSRGRFPDPAKGYTSRCVVNRPTPITP